MTTFDDLTNSFVTSLQKLTSYLPKVISHFQQADTTFRNQKNDLISGYVVNFSGMGGLMYSEATENNIQIASRLESKLSEFVTDSDHTRQQIQNINNQYDGDISNYTGAYYIGGVEGLDYYNISVQDVINEMRDGTLGGYIDVGDVITQGLSTLLSNAEQMKNAIQANVVALSARNMQTFEDNYNHFKSMHQGQDPGNYYKVEIYEPEVMQENNALDEAKRQIEQIYTNEINAFQGWYNAIVGQLAIYNAQIGWASATGELTVGELLQDLTNAPNGAPLVIYQTKNGLVVLVNSINNGKNAQQNALLIQQAIQEYEEENGLTNAKVTLLGYQGGTSIVQELAKDNNPFQVTNVVLVGGKITEVPQIGVNYTDYVAPGDVNAGTGNPTFGNSGGDWANYGVDIGEVVLGEATGGVGGVLTAAGEVIVSTGVSMAAGSNSGDVSGASNGGEYFETPPYIPPGKTVGSRTLIAVPNEPGEESSGWKLTSEFPFVYGKTINYTQSTYLNMITVPDPNTGQPVQDIEPLSPPTYYTLP